MEQILPLQNSERESWKGAINQKKSQHETTPFDTTNESIIARPRMHDRIRFPNLAWHCDQEDVCHPRMPGVVDLSTSEQLGSS